MHKRLPTLASALALTATFVASAAHAEAPLADATAVLAEDVAQPMTADEVAAFLAPFDKTDATAGVLATEDLKAISGGADIHAGILSNQELTATNSDNVIGGSVQSGDIQFSGQSLGGFSGIGNFVLNTGAQNNLQGSITINVLTAAP